MEIGELFKLLIYYLLEIYIITGWTYLLGKIWPTRTNWDSENLANTYKLRFRKSGQHVQTEIPKILPTRTNRDSENLANTYKPRFRENFNLMKNFCLWIILVPCLRQRWNWKHCNDMYMYKYYYCSAITKNLCERSKEFSLMKNVL